MCNDGEGNMVCGVIQRFTHRPAESETLSIRGRSMNENREVPAAPKVQCGPGRSGKPCGHNPDAYAAGKSDIGVVPGNARNKAGMRHEAGDGGTVTPPRDRKSAAGNPPPGAALAAWSVGPRTRGRKGR